MVIKINFINLFPFVICLMLNIGCNSNLSGEGEKCRTTVDCKKGFVCLDSSCFDDEVYITSINPSEVSPGDIVRLEGMGFDLYRSKGELILNGRPYPILDAAYGWVKFFAPPLEKGEVSLSVKNASDKKSNVMSLKFKNLPQNNQAPGLITVSVKEKLLSLMVSITLMFDSLIEKGVISDEASDEFRSDTEKWLLFAEKLLFWENNLSDEEKQILDSVFYNNGMYGMLFSGVSSQKPEEICKEKGKACLYVLYDQLSFFLSLLGGITAQTAFAAESLSSQSGNLSLLREIGRMSLFCRLAEDTINLFIPTDIAEIGYGENLYTGNVKLYLNLLDSEEKRVDLYGLFSTQEMFFDKKYGDVVESYMKHFFANIENDRELLRKELEDLTENIMSDMKIEPEDRLLKSYSHKIADTPLWQDVAALENMFLYGSTMDQYLNSYIGFLGIGTDSLFGFLDQIRVHFNQLNLIEVSHPDIVSANSKDSGLYIWINTEIKPISDPTLRINLLKFNRKNVNPYSLKKLVSDWIDSVEKEIEIKVTQFEKNSIISGLVLDVDENTPIENADIDIFRYGVYQDSVVTDNNGFYKREFRPGEGYHLEIYKEGYLTLEKKNIIIEPDIDVYLETLRLIRDEADDNKHNITGRIFNVEDGSLVENATVKIRKGFNNYFDDVLFSVQSDEKGIYDLYNTGIGYYTTEIIRAGFIPAFTNLYSSPNVTGDQDSFITKKLSAGSIRIVMTWKNNPEDLDAHITGPLSENQRFHIYFGERNNEFGELNYDSKRGVNLETITAFNRVPGIYRYYVHDHSNRNSENSYALSYSEVEVSVYRGSSLINIFHVPSGQVGNLWAVFEMEGEIVYPVNQMSNESNPENIK